MIDYELNLEVLRSNLGLNRTNKKIEHNFNKVARFLPFKTRKPERPTFHRGFIPVVGEFVRCITGLELSKIKSSDEALSNMLNSVKVHNESDKPFLEKIIRNYIESINNRPKAFNPYIYHYISLSDNKESVGEKEIGLFLKDVLIGDDDKRFREYFMYQKNKNILTDIVISKIGDLEEYKYNTKYCSCIPEITEYFKEDFGFMVKHEDFFKQNFSLFLSYYYFTYITQFSLKINKMFESDFTALIDSYYFLDWEKANKSRKGCDFGYMKIKQSAKNLLVHMNLLDHINIIMGFKEAKNYTDIASEFDKLSPTEQTEFNQTLKKWIDEYRELANLSPIPNNTDFETNIKHLFSSLNDFIANETKSRYALFIESIGKKYFLKTRGALGTVLNCSQDLLLMMTALIVKNERMPFAEYLKQLNNRGLNFDRYSVNEIVKLFDKLNLIDKKSDSGDAQYVKQIL